MTEKTPIIAPRIHDELARSLEDHIIIRSLREINASSDVVRAAAHVLVDRVFDQVDTTTIITEAAAKEE